MKVTLFDRPDPGVGGDLDADVNPGLLEVLPGALLERLEHYFSTYKLVPGEPPAMSIVGRYGFADAAAVIRASIEDYAEMYSHQT